jgi:D-beta-D-heptose 7-phosphate kinase/D-beta-D-heptose 1-phosphate adenosyltransferase
MTTLPDLIDRLPEVEVLVVGDVILDRYVGGETRRLCREAPVPVVSLGDRLEVPGGAGNTAANVAALGGRVELLSVIGGDDAGVRLRGALADAGVGTRHLLTASGRSTLVKTRVSVGSQMLARLDEGSDGPLDAAVEDRLIARLRERFPGVDAVVVSDYRSGVVTPRVIDALAELQARAPQLVVVDAKRASAYRHVGVTAVKPNYPEAAALLEAGRPGDDGRVDRIEEEGARLLELTGADIAAVTLDSEGALVFERGRPPHRTYSEPVDPRLATGAGDTFTSAFTLALAARAHTPAAAELASMAAAVVVRQPGTTSCSVQELRAELWREDKHVDAGPSLEHLVAFHRGHGRRLVFTNGCFDLLHRGHIGYLNQAKALGDVLIVGLNSDRSVRRLKGPDRPINRLEDRLEVLAALSCVDHIVPFDQPTSEALIRVIRPDVFVKGGDYTPALLPEAPLVGELGGEVRILPYVRDRSTTGIIQRIRAADPETAPAT